MSQTPPSSPESRRQEGISLEELAQAFAQVMEVSPQLRPGGEQMQGSPLVEDHAAEGAPEPVDAGPEIAEQPSLDPAQEDAGELSPRNILEAILFVGNRDNTPFSAAKAAELMRDVASEEIPLLVDELNRDYELNNCPYQIVGEGDGYRLVLKKDFFGLRNKFYGRIREARLSQAAIDVLALVAYQQPLTGEKINRLRGKPSSHILAHLVRRGLLRIERPDAKRRAPHYYTTDRFLRLFNLQSLEDLPHGEETGK